jgi:hypothetical protein
MALPKMHEIELGFETPETLFGIPLPKLSFKGTFAPDETEQNFAWGIYVELVTRVTLAPLGAQEGSLREALSSWYKVFAYIRDQLHQAGPDVGRRHSAGTLPLAASALWMLNGVIRPLLAEWHPRLARYEETRAPATGAFTHEAAWGDAESLRHDMEQARIRVRHFAELFEKVCNVKPSLIPGA